jgi:osmotically inducible protein OsmC
MKRTTTVIWKGSGKEGSGNITTQSGALDKSPYAWNTRFENGKGTNPEELIAAAHAGCFTMKLSFLLTDAGFKPDTIETTAEVTLEKDAISHSHLKVKANVPGISTQKFEECANNAKENCLVSKALNLSITMDASLNENIMA